MYLDTKTTPTDRNAIANMAIMLQQRNADYHQLLKRFEQLDLAERNIKSCILLTRARQELQAAHHSERRALQALLSFEERLQET